MNLMDFAKTLSEAFGDRDFVARVNTVIDLRAIQGLSTSERQALHDFAQYLSDYMLLLHECLDGVAARNGAPILQYRGPFLETILTREPDTEVDRSQLENLGVGVATARFG